MSAAEALKAARATGIRLGVDGDALMLDADAAPSRAVLELLSRHKAGVVALLRKGDDGWPGEDWLAFFDERAGIAEFDGGLARHQAEARAFDCCIVEWLNGNPPRSLPGRCLSRGAAEGHQDPLVPFGTGKSDQAWLHPRCWPTWHNARKAEAAEALMAIGIGPVTEFPDDFGKNRDA